MLLQLGLCGSYAKNTLLVFSLEVAQIFLVSISMEKSFTKFPMVIRTGQLGMFVLFCMFCCLKFQAFNFLEVFHSAYFWH